MDSGKPVIVTLVVSTSTLASCGAQASVESYCSMVEEFGRPYLTTMAGLFASPDALQDVAGLWRKLPQVAPDDVFQDTEAVSHDWLAQEDRLEAGTGSGWRPANQPLSEDSCMPGWENFPEAVNGTDLPEDGSLLTPVGGSSLDADEVLTPYEWERWKYAVEHPVGWAVLADIDHDVPGELFPGAVGTSHGLMTAVRWSQRREVRATVGRRVTSS